VPRGLDEILATFAALIEAHEEAAEEPSPEGGDNFRCVACERCSNCRFCTACVDCDDCTYCDACNDCQSCTQSRQCHGCVEISHSSFSAGCQRSSYLTLCYDCEDCVHCFGCVGLSGEEFCVLNERYARKEYFALVSRLRTELDVRSTEGWQPPWVDDEAEPEPPPAEPPRVATFEDPWLSITDWDEIAEPEPLRTDHEVSRDQGSAAPAPAPVRATSEEGPTRPYPVVDAPRTPSLRAARRPVRPAGGQKR
jgi:hypothetical protein